MSGAVHPTVIVPGESLTSVRPVGAGGGSATSTTVMVRAAVASVSVLVAPSGPFPSWRFTVMV